MDLPLIDPLGGINGSKGAKLTPSEPTTRYRVYVPSQWSQALSEEATRRGISVPILIRIIVCDYLNPEE